MPGRREDDLDAVVGRTTSPNQPSRGRRRGSARGRSTTGETANGRSTSALSERLAAEACGAPARARATTPKTVFSGTAIATHDERQPEGVLAVGRRDRLERRRSRPRTCGRRPSRRGPRAARRGSRARRSAGRSVRDRALGALIARLPPALETDAQPTRAAADGQRTSSTRETAAAPVALSLSIWPKM